MKKKYKELLEKIKEEKNTKIARERTCAQTVCSAYLLHIVLHVKNKPPRASTLRGNENLSFVKKIINERDSNVKS